MKSRRLIARTIALLLSLAIGSSAPGYVFILDDSGCVSTWREGAIPMLIKLNNSRVLTDGTTEVQSVLAAIQEWTQHLGTVQFVGTAAAPGSYGIWDGTSEIVMDNAIQVEDERFPFDEFVLAVTISFDDGNTTSESDIVFNTAYQWDSFRGGQISSKHDIRRVAAHELGHVLGLDHPDQAEPPQYVEAIMNYAVNYSFGGEELKPDDIAGAQQLYGHPGFVPTNDDFEEAVAIVVPEEGSSFSGTNVAATSEAGEPTLDPDDPGGKTVWWSWTATAGGTLTVTTLGSNFDTLLGAYTGTALNTLTQLALNDDVESGVIRSSTVTLNVDMGTTYYFAVDGWRGTVGTIQLNFSIERDPLRSPPFFEPRPTSRNIIEGTNVSIPSGVPHIADATFEWRRNRMLLSQQTGPSLNLPAAAISDSGAYQLTVTNPRGTSHTYFHLRVVPSDSTLVLWGDPPSSLPEISEFSPVSSVNSTGSVIAWVKADGVIKTSGFGSAHQITGEGGYVEGSFQSEHGLALREDGTLKGWGYTQIGVENIPAGVAPAIQVATGRYMSVALRANGTVRSWGTLVGIPQPNGLDDIIQIAGASQHVIALRSDGTVVGWGRNDNGQAAPPTGLGGVTAIAAGGYGGDGGGHSLALRSDGTVVAWGTNWQGQCNVPVGLGDVVAVGAGDNASYAVKGDGTLVAWGAGSHGELEAPDQAGDFIKVAGGDLFAVALVRPVPKEILSEPADLTVSVGMTASFSV
ncbi:MAG TPA: matrixin family metalloprotease, partial [Rhodothermales bacterium]|nr:matrixin family metalloprotease [Rhodothermales bacterium]